ncbi:DUF1015 domain-containing protein [Ruminiclostridium cellulolyticum]|uniref:DUF1015 domain-containing protein n=1 Tax=Ruminiclostridium cellulolyticum (strain ATCC 35319 / DSM 5812 / JCM 6584 / H10) TaxID=394503 RepID=B8I0H5_RUMCH|nr:DUF1015 domain-containing protein [Ruminiclostridium cellulolyticum]ACL75550.1 conserved hypothetical protein [Ruminiclostridium cellulolyticum H10]
MDNYKKTLSELGLFVPKIMLPDSKYQLEKWAVVACDQYTSERSYWEKVAELTKGNPSTYNIIFPEVYLEDGDNDTRINTINNNMENYIQSGIINELDECFILVDRKTSHTQSRKGLMVALDLEHYDYTKGSSTLIRATEGTVIERLPPRIKIRQNAPIELPHIMVLIDDPDKKVIEPLAQKADTLEKLYDFELMMNGGHIKGYHVSDKKDISAVADALRQLSDLESYRNKYGLENQNDVLLFAVGDGNHSLASAKGHWENVKLCLSYEEQQNHPARYALVELVNVHDEGLVFEPIHRVLFNVDSKNLLKEFALYYKANSKNKASKEHTFKYITSDGSGEIQIDNPVSNLEVGTLQAFLDYYIKEHPQVKIDYIHGEDVVTKLGAQPGNMGIYLPSMNKTELFKTVILDGALPRKTFSMGEAEEKRFYLECRKIK